MTAYREKGFTLIESIVAIVVLGISMTVLTTVLYPQIENSASSHYQVRASALAQSMMTEVLSRSFDEHSDINGGIDRCGESSTLACTDQVDFGPDGVPAELPAQFNDVDDYIGCWYASTTKSSCTQPEAGNITDVLGISSAETYKNFRIEIEVKYDNSAGLLVDQTVSGEIFKKITLTIYPGKYGEYRFIAYKGNF
ncbi:prepilin-type N-terminal cleavage/methylation domain-containing protein [Vibrio tapetis]|uniref:MSHA pilin protein MshD n=1 Tax=Vibrio tapetis subsp. tapetis TaxID=1671868 RepID=A0A2N8ZFI3_9VIBR|nr:type II secretion system protein [Vibrio tapetis]SON50677.1 MSHA pilin protein MshD [Vibrio tapetis subsp. tapetis]